MSELDDLRVYGETGVGWCENTPVNETVDGDGTPITGERGFGQSDPRSPKRRIYDDPDVVALREKLRAENGIRGLEICGPHETERAARIFHRDGFVVVRDLLNAEQIEVFREGSARILRDILSIPGTDGRKYLSETGRLPHRYSYGTASSSRHLLHDEVWASMIDLPTTTPILEKMFGSLDYHVIGAGGDLCLPGAVEYQHLHYDSPELNEMTEARIAQAERMGVRLKRDDRTGELNLRSQRKVVEMTPPMITINFVMSELTWENGPIRQIPGTHAMAQQPPSSMDEPDWMRHSTLVGALPGAGVFRDNRAWHGATPNLSRQVRALPNVEYGAPWNHGREVGKPMPYAIWETLSPHAQKLCENIREEPGVWPAGAGIMHPHSGKRAKAKEQNQC